MAVDRETWMRAVRATRAAPPHRAGREALRRAIYGAALQQFEELLSAAVAVGAASRPLPLFYALSQGGRAIVAARGDCPEVSGHGLREARDGTQPADLLHRRVERAPLKSGHDAFGAVAAAIRSPDFSGGVELGAVWAATPWSYRVPDESWREDWRLALGVNDGVLARDLGEGVNVMVDSMGGNPHVEARNVLKPDRYPTLPSGARAAFRKGSDELGRGYWIADLNFPLAGEAEATLDAVAPKIALSDRRALVPCLPGHSEPLPPLLLWWILLFGLSICARYHPAAWLEALGVDRSPSAVPLEGVLENALDALPPLIYEALTGEG